MAGAESRSSAEGVKALVEILGMDVGHTNIFARSLDSSNIGPEELEIIIAKVREWKARKDALMDKGDPNVKGMMLATGTDTMGEVALALSLEFSGSLQFPIVLFGTHTPYGVPGSDALENMMNAKQLAEDPRTPPLVYAVIGKEIFLGSRLEKVFTKPTQEGGHYFEDYAGRVGHFDDAGQIVWDSAFIALARSFHRERGLQRREDFGYVEHLIIDQATPAMVVKDAVSRIKKLRISDEASGVRRRYGLVLQGNFAHNKETSAIQGVCAEALNSGIPVFTGSKSVKKKLQSSIFFIEKKNFRYPHVRTKLSWLLRQGVPFEKLQEEINADYAGETHGEELPPYVSSEVFALNDCRSGQEVIKAFPGMRAEIFSDSIQRLIEFRQSHPDEEPVLSVFAFGDGNLPTGKSKIHEVVEDFLKKEIPEIATKASLRDLKLFELERKISSMLKGLSAEEFNAVLERFYIPAPGLYLHESVLEKNPSARKGLQVLKSKLISELKGFGITDEGILQSIEQARKRATLRQRLRNIQMPLALSDVLASAPGIHEELARRIIKEALMDYHPILKAIGQAVDSGIQVNIRTAVVWGDANTRIYELGNMLLACGADSKGASGWKDPIAFRHSRAHAMRKMSPQETVDALVHDEFSKRAPDWMATDYQPGYLIVRDTLPTGVDSIDGKISEARKQLIMSTTDPLIMRRAEDLLEALKRNPAAMDLPLLRFEGVANKMVKNTTGTEDPFLIHKNRLDRIYRDIYSYLNRDVAAIQDPDQRLKTAMMIAGIGNLMDIGQLEALAKITSDSGIQIDLSKEIPMRELLKLMRAVQRKIIDEDLAIGTEELDAFLEAIKARPGGKIIYFTDNHGEVILDQLVVEQLLEAGYRVAVVSRGETVRDDVTTKEAVELFGQNDSLRRFMQAGRLEILSSGSSILGTDLAECHGQPQFQLAWSESIAYIAKGAGNALALLGQKLSLDGFHIRMMKEVPTAYELLRLIRGREFKQRSPYEIAFTYQPKAREFAQSPGPPRAAAALAAQHPADAAL